MCILRSKWCSKNDEEGYLYLLLSYRGSNGKLITYYNYCKIIQLFPSNDGIVQGVLIAYHIQSAKAKQMYVDIRRLAVL